MPSQKSELNFKGQNIYAGIDIHLKSWTVTILTEKLYHKTFTLPGDPSVLCNYLNRMFPGGEYYSAYEAGFCGFWVHRQLCTLGIKNIVVNPADVATKQNEQLQKDDPVDSRKIARELRSGNLDAIFIPSSQSIEIRSLVRTRYRLVSDMSRFKNRIKSHLYFHGIHYPQEFEKSGSHWSGRFMKWLKEDVCHRPGIGKDSLEIIIREAEYLRTLLLEVTRKLRTLFNHENYANDIRLLRTIPGIGFITAITLLVEIDDIHRFANTDKFANYVGLVPTRHGSGEKKNVGNITFRGNKIIRNYLIESSWVAARMDPALTCYYHDCSNKNKEANKVVVKIARRVLNRIYFVLKNKKEYVCAVVK